MFWFDMYYLKVYNSNITKIDKKCCFTQACVYFLIPTTFSQNTERRKYFLDKTTPNFSLLFYKKYKRE